MNNFKEFKRSFAIKLVQNLDHIWHKTLDGWNFFEKCIIIKSTLNILQITVVCGFYSYMMMDQAKNLDAMQK